MLHTPDLLLPAADPGMGLLVLVFRSWRDIFPKPPQTEEFLFLLEDHPSQIHPAPVPARLADGRCFSCRTFSDGCGQGGRPGPFGASLVPGVGNTACNHTANQDSTGQTWCMQLVSSDAGREKNAIPVAPWVDLCPFSVPQGCGKTIYLQTLLRAHKMDGFYPTGMHRLPQWLGGQSETHSAIFISASKPFDKLVAHTFILSISFNVVILIIN